MKLVSEPGLQEIKHVVVEENEFHHWQKPQQIALFVNFVLLDYRRRKHDSEYAYGVPFPLKNVQ